MPDSLANHKLVDRPQLLTERSEFFKSKAAMSVLITLISLDKYQARHFGVYDGDAR